MADMDEATDIEIKADKVVQAIVAKGPELVLAVHKRLDLEVEKTALPWRLIAHRTRVNQYAIVRKASDGTTVVARVERKPGWMWQTLPTVKGRGDDVWDAMTQADAELTLSGRTLMPGFPTATPWTEVEGSTEPLWVRREEDGAPNSELVRVGQATEKKGSNWYWLVTKLGGPGPTEPAGPWASKALAMKEADMAMRNIGWITP